ncbi:hypothetical protein WI560_06290 [Bradyrhizobium sp. A11]|jgi:hypothetical protein|nr:MULTISPECIES: hypothetical protein [Bradyrhizobium]
MKKLLLAVAAVATLAVAAGTPAHAQRGVAAGVAAGIIGGAIVGGALASPYYYGPGPGYYEPGYYPPRYYAPGPGYVSDGYYGRGYYGGGCVWQKQRFWDGYAWRIRRVRVCG